MEIKKVHVVFKTHLDIGFTDTAANVVRTYFERHIPEAVKTANELNAGREKPVFIWTTGSWLIHEYLATQPDEKAHALQKAIRKGYVAWHALPFTTHTELMDERLFRFGLSLAEDLDRRFSRSTVAAMMTDVPGHTIGVVSPLARQGVQYLHIGVNEGSAVPDVPEFFRWRDAAGAEVIVNYAGDYGAVHTLEGLDEALAVVFTEDNEGPCAPAQVLKTIDTFRDMFPGAEVFASTLDSFALSLQKVKDRLPVITSEIGDTWIHGVGTDPAKVSRFQALLRLRDQWISQGRMDERDAEYRAFCGKLLLVPEHTWGLDLKTHLPDFANYSKADFQKARQKDAVEPDALPKEYAFALKYFERQSKGALTYSAFEASWKEKREYIDQAIASLGEETKEEAQSALRMLTPVRKPALAAQMLPGEPVCLRGLTATFGGDGSLSVLRDDRGRTLSLGLAEFAYQTYSAGDYQNWFERYSRNMGGNFQWAMPDSGKPGMELVRPKIERRLVRPQLSTLSVDPADGKVRAVSHMPKDACDDFGAPTELHTEYSFERGRIEIEFQWFGKDANRLPEALWLGFRLGGGGGRLALKKLGCLVSPYDVVSRGNRNLHACQAVEYKEDGIFIQLETLDAPLLSVRGMDILDFSDEIPTEGGVIFVNLYNNIWGTNFPMWYSDDGKFRFGIRIQG